MCIYSYANALLNINIHISYACYRIQLRYTCILYYIYTGIDRYVDVYIYILCIHVIVFTDYAHILYYTYICVCMKES